jgi:hypothetical protein
MRRLIIEQRYRNAVTAKITCNSDSTLSGVWKSIFKKIPISFDLKRLIGFHANEEKNSYVEKISKISDLIHDSLTLDVDQITAYLEEVKVLNVNFLLLFDEFDQIRDAQTVQGFADIIKYLSDNITNVTVMIVGIGRSIKDLIGQHESIARCIRQVRLERMSDDELAEIVTTATQELEMSINLGVVQSIVKYSSGFPHYTHLLGKFSTKKAIEQKNVQIEPIHFTGGMTDALNNVNETILNAYQSAVLSSKGGILFEEILYACALVEPDEHGTFRASDLQKIINKLHKSQINIQAYQYHL